MNIKYTLAFIQKGNQILMLNREKSPWMGSWNGVGGKIETGEDKFHSVQREILEETGISIPITQITYKGIVTWEDFDAMGNGLYLFHAIIDDESVQSTLMKTSEGILDWKSIAWIVNQKNTGVAANIPYFLPKMLETSEIYRYHSVFYDGKFSHLNTSILEEI